ncbi:MAG: MFS transporter [Candidatus Limnocylindrales bacterium]
MPRSVIGNPDFVRLWIAETISQFGTQVSLLALPLVAVTLLQASPFEVALLGTIEFLPFILFSLPAGAWVDRLRRRPILIAGDVGRAMALSSVPLAFMADALSIWQLYVVGFVTGTLTVLFDVAYQSYLPSLVERDQLIDGNGKLEVSRTLAQTAGPALGGGLIGLVTAPLAILADAVSFGLSALFVLLIRRPEPSPDIHHDEHGRRRGSLVGEIRDGLRYVLGNRYLRGIAASTATFNFFGNIAQATFIVYAVRVLELQPAEIGIVFGLGNIGAIVGAIVTDRLRRRFGLGRSMVYAVALSGPGVLLVALAPREAPIPFLIAAGLLTGFSAVVYNINQVSFRQAITPTAMQGRMNASMRFMVWGPIPIGQLVGGTIATIFSIPAALWVGGLGAFLAVVPLLITPVRTLRDMPTPAEAEAPTGVDTAD